MREHQVAPARLDIEGRPEVLDGDRGTFHVPAWPAGTEARVPGWLTGALRAPDERVERVLLPRPVRVAAALGGEGRHLLHRKARRAPRTRQRAEPRVGAAREVD